MDASMLAQPLPFQQGPPSSPEELESRTQQWLQIMQNPRVQQEVQRYKAVQGLLGFGARFTQNLGMGAPGGAAFGNAVGAGMDVMGNIDQEMLKNSMSLAKQQAGEDETRVNAFQQQRKLEHEGKQLEETSRHNRAQEALYGQHISKMGGGRGAGAKNVYGDKQIIDQATKLAGPQPKCSDFESEEDCVAAQAEWWDTFQNIADFLTQRVAGQKAAAGGGPGPGLGQAYGNIPGVPFEGGGGGGAPQYRPETGAPRSLQYGEPLPDVATLSTPENSQGQARTVQEGPPPPKQMQGGSPWDYMNFLQQQGVSAPPIQRPLEEGPAAQVSVQALEASLPPPLLQTARELALMESSGDPAMFPIEYEKWLRTLARSSSMSSRP